MKIASEIHKLTTLIKRYWVEGKKQFLHYGDCEIYSAHRSFCSCGLLHQLRYSDYTLAEIVYPRFTDDLYFQDIGSRKKKKSKKETAEAMKLLESVFGPMQKPNYEDLKMDYDDMSKILNTVFTKKMFPGAFRRLENWVKKEVTYQE
jgi:hypothetical protein